MGTKYQNFSNGISLEAKASSGNVSKGDLEVTFADGKLNYHNGTTTSPVVTESHTATLTNKTLTLPKINENVILDSNSTQLNYLKYLPPTLGTTGFTNSKLVFSDSPSLTTPNIGIATATSVNKLSITTPANSATLTIADGKTLTVSNILTFTGTDSSSVAFSNGGTVAYIWNGSSGNKLSEFASTTSAELAGVINGTTGFNAGTGNLVFSNAPVLTNPETNQLKLNGSTSGAITLLPSAITANYQITLPPTQPSSGTALYYDNSGNYVWQSVATAKKTKYTYVVGSSAEVSAGSADYASINSAINALPSGGGSILVSSNYSTVENVTITKNNVLIEGQGNNSVITGTVTIDVSKTNCSLTNLRITTGIILSTGSKYNFITNTWIPSTASITNNGSLNYILVIKE